MQMTFVVNIDDRLKDDPEETIGSQIEDHINSFSSSTIDRVVVQKVFLTRPESLVRIDEDTAVRLFT